MRATPGGTLVEKCCHYFDLFNLFAQSKPVSVFAVGDMAVNFTTFEYDRAKSDIIDHAVVTVTYENGIKANFNLCMFSPMFSEEIILCGDQGRIRAHETEDFLPGAALNSGFEMHCSNGIPSKQATPHYPAIIEQSGHNGSTFFEHVKFIDHINGDGGDTATPEQGLWSILVGVAAEESIKKQRAVAIDELL